MKTTTTLLRRAAGIVVLIFSVQFASAQWTTITNDASGDGADATRLDGTKLEFRYTPADDSLHFRVTVASISAAQAGNFGVNVMVNLDAGSKFNFWGTSNMNTWSKLVTTWVTGPPYVGTIGIANAQGVGSMNYTNLSSNNISIVLDQAANTITLGMKRTDLITNADMAGNSTITVRAAAAVGASTAWNDDIYNLTDRMTLNNVVNSVGEVKTGVAKLYPNPANGLVTVELPANEELNASILVTDILGKQQTVAVSSSNNILTVNTESLANGVYWLTATNTNGVNYREKLVVMK